MRIVGLLVLIAWVFGGNVKADIVWTSDVTVVGYDYAYGGGFSAEDTGTGISFAGSCFNSDGCSESSMVYRTFTVTSPGTFNVSGDLTASGTSFSCSPAGCRPYAASGGSFDDTDSVGTLTFDLVANGYNQTDPCSICQASITLSDSNSFVIALDAGDYGLSETYDDGFGGTGSSSSSYSGDLSITPTPEPSTVPPLVGFTGCLLLYFRKLRRGRTPGNNG
jgi:hypothetical protein